MREFSILRIIFSKTKFEILGNVVTLAKMILNTLENVATLALNVMTLAKMILTLLGMS